MGEDVVCVDEGVFMILGVGAAAAPAVVFWFRDDFGCYRVEVDVFADVQLVFAGVDPFCPVAVFEDVSFVAIFLIEVPGIVIVDQLNDGACGGIDGFDLEVEMVGHQAVGMEGKLVFLFGFS